MEEFYKDEKGNVRGARVVKLQSVKDPDTGRMTMVPIPGSEEEIPADVVLIAAGFLGCESYVADTFGAVCNERRNLKTAQIGRAHV